MSDNQDDIARRVRALLNKTVENGCTEQEALAAAAAARRIMDAHRLTQSDVQIEAEPIDDVLIDRPTDRKLAAVDHCLHGIDAYCGVKTWFGNKGSKRVVRMIGLRPDVEMGRYLYAMIAATIASEVKAFARANDRLPGSAWREAAETRRVNQSFQVGMAVRINTRLKEMARALESVAKTSTGTALVVVKSAVVDAAFDNLGIRFGGRLSGMRARDSDAYAAGRAAGDRVNLSRPVGGVAQGRLAG